MKKIFLGIVFAMIFLVVAGIFMVSAEGQSITQEVKDTVKAKFSGGNVSANVENFVGEFVEKSGIQTNQIQDIKPVDFDSLPKEVNIQGVGDNNLAIYEINYNDQGKQEQIFVVSYVVEELKAQGDLIIASDKRNFLNFGTSSVMDGSGFLETATGVETSGAKGYLMMRKGSITALSTNLEIIQSNPGSIEIVIYKNGQPISFGNTLSGSSLGVAKDYDVQSRGVVTFEPGDVISAYVLADSGLAWRDVIMLIEITTMN